MSIAIVERGPWDGIDIAGGRYRKLATLGEGGMGFVYRAFDANLKTQVVIKSPRQSLVENSDQIARFEREIGALVKLSFPQIVPISDVGRYDGIPFAVMRYLSGGSLTDQMRRGSPATRCPMSLASLRTWLASIAKALDFVHMQKYVHRDVKPSNILFDQHGQAYLSDFGIIQVLGDRANDGDPSGVIMGTVDYLAPELIAGKGCDGRADQYALAVTVYEALAGELPFGKLPSREVANAQLSGKPPSLAEIAPGVPRAISVAVDRALAKAPEQRFARCSDFAREVLRAAIASQPSAQTTLSASASAPEVALHDTAPVGPAPTKVQPRHPLHAADRDRATRSVSVRPYEVPATAARRRSRWRVPAFVAAAVLTAGLAGMALFSRYSESDTTTPQPGRSSAELGQRIANWTSRIHTAEQSIVVGSQPILNHPQYGSAAELAELIAARATEPRAEVRQELNGFDRELSELRGLIAQLAADVDKSLMQSGPASTGTDAARDALLAEQRSLKEQESILSGCDDRLQHLRRIIESPTGSQDKAAAAEIAALREMEASQAARRRIDVSQSTLDRAAELVDAVNGRLASTSLACLARSPNPVRNHVAIMALANIPADRQGDVCWSLLLSGERGAIAAASRHLDSHSNLASALKMDELLALAKESPKSYEPLFGVLAAWPQSPEQREKLFRLQAPLMNDEWMIEVQRACESGALRDRVPAVLAAILNERWSASYPLAARLLDSHPSTSLDSISAAGLGSWCEANAELGNKLVQRFITRGKPAQRDAAMAIYCRPQSPIHDAELFQCIRDTHGANSMDLLNRLLSCTDDKSLRLAEVVLEGSGDLAPQEVAYDRVSDAAAGRKAIRDPLFNLAGQSNGVGRAWALRQLLGRNFINQLARAEADRVRQLSALKAALAVLDKRLVALSGAETSGDRGLVVAAGELKTLPTDFNPADWQPEGNCSRTLVALRARITEVGLTAPAASSDDLRLIDNYLDTLQTLTSFSYEMAQVYDPVVAKQIAGANRQLKSKPEPSWTFRFFKESLDVFLRRRREYESLARKSDESRASLPKTLK